MSDARDKEPGADISGSVAPDANPPNAAPYLALILVQLMFGSLAVLGKLVLRSISPAELVGLRIAGATVCLLSLRALLPRATMIQRSDYARLGLCSLLGVVLNQLFFIKGLTLSTVTNATLINSGLPVFTLALSALLGQDSISLRKLGGMASAIVGIVYLVDPTHADFSQHTTWGNLLLLLNVTCYACYIVLSRDLIRRYGPLEIVSWVFVLANVVTIPFAWLNTDPAALLQVGKAGWIGLLLIILVPTVGGYGLSSWVLKRLEPGTVAVYGYLQPIIAFLFARVLLHEAWNPRAWVAIPLIFAGVFVATISAPFRRSQTTTA